MMGNERFSGAGSRFAITISREMGSLGLEIARLVGESLGYQVVARDLINQAARRAGAPEAALAAIDELGLLGTCPSQKACHAYHKAVRQVIEELADEGNVVIVGRAGQVILHDREDVLNVRITAPVPVRVERVARRQQIPLDCAQAQVEASDKFRKNYLKRYYHVRWDDPQLYDLILNTEHLSVDTTAEVIRQAALLSLNANRQVTVP